jgi:hypothetical protein
MLPCMTTCQMDEVWLKLEIQNGRKEVVVSMKTIYICIYSGFYKQGRILSKFGMQVSIGYVIFYMFQELWNKKNWGKILV